MILRHPSHLVGFPYMKSFHLCFFTGSLLICFLSQALFAQPPGRESRGEERPPGETPKIDPNTGKPIEMKPGESKPGESKPEEGKPDEANKDAAATPGVTKRPTEPAEKPNPEEFKVRPDEAGRVSFAFRNQPWPQLLEWLAEISGEPLDWQELPGDYVNLASPGAYTIAETRDLFTRHLMARGYTLLRLDGGLAVVKTSELNPAMVPAVDKRELATMPPYQYARTVFALDWLTAEKVVEDLKPLISSAGKLIPLTSTNRIEAMDAVVNLRRIAELLDDEESTEARDGLAREFALRHIPAVNAKKMLEEFLGVSQSSRSSMDPRQMQQIMQMMQERMGGRSEGSRPDANKKEPQVAIVANERTNSIIIHAPADRMAIAAEFVKRVDVPGSDIHSLADVKTRVQTFRLASLDPEKLGEMLTEMNVLEPTTKIKVDEDNKAIVVYGSAADRYIIQELITRLDGSGRKFSVLQLRRLDAREVTESISFLMGVDDSKDENQSRSRYSYYDYGSRNSDKKKEDKFRVAANVRQRQVLVWANDLELEEVKNLLIKLGELPADGSGGSRMRTIEASNSTETYEYLQRLKQHWDRISPNPLSLPPRELFKEDQEPAKADPEKPEPGKANTPETKPIGQKKDDVVARTASPFGTFIAARGPAAGAEENNAQATTQVAPQAEPKVATPQAGEAEQKPANPLPEIRSAEDFDRAFGERPPVKKNAEEPKSNEEIRVEVAPDGSLVLMSDDPEALNRLESLMLQNPPPKKPHAVFYVKNTRPSYIVINLEEYFESGDSKNDSDSRFYRWIFGFNDEKKDEGVGLASGAKLKFLYDNDTNSIIVINADAQQLAIIEDLIKLWDVAEPSRQTSRYTKLIEIKHSKAQTIADTIKEAYRDLLSSNDKTFQNQGQGGEGRSRSSGGGSDLVDQKSGQNSGGTSFSFKGDLSIGVDAIGNTLLISAKGEELLSLVTAMIEQLDRAAEPASEVEVIKIQGGSSIESTLRAMLGDKMTSSSEGSSSSSSSSRDSRDRDSRDRDSRSSSSSSRRR